MVLPGFVWHPLVSALPLTVVVLVLYRACKESSVPRGMWAVSWALSPWGGWCDDTFFDFGAYTQCYVGSSCYPMLDMVGAHQ